MLPSLIPVSKQDLIWERSYIYATTELSIHWCLKRRWWSESVWQIEAPHLSFHTSGNDIISLTNWHWLRGLNFSFSLFFCTMTVNTPIPGKVSLNGCSSFQMAVVQESKRFSAQKALLWKKKTCHYDSRTSGFFFSLFLCNKMQSSWTHKSHWVFIYLIIYFSNSYIGVPTFQPFWFILGLSNIQIHFGLFLFFATHCQNCKCRCNKVIFKHPFHLKLRMFACSSLKCQKVTTLSTLLFFLQVDLWHLDFLVSLSTVLSVVT